MARNTNQADKRRVFGYAELIFDIFYLIAALGLALYFLTQFNTSTSRWAAAAAFVLVGGDAFHLIPRIAAIMTSDTERFQKPLGFGKFITSISMTIFYLILWKLVLSSLAQPIAVFWTAIYCILAVSRIALCIPKQNNWFASEQAEDWSLYRNIPFFLMGLILITLCFVNAAILNLLWIGIAVLLSFLFYFPVVLWVNKNRMLGMLMLPKSLAYLWILFLLIGLLT